MPTGKRKRNGRGTGANRYDPWAQAKPDPLPEARTPAQARTWAEFMAMMPNGHNAKLPAPPHRLDWQRNPRAPIPPGYTRAVCLCGDTIVREPDTLPKPRVTVGSRCFVCNAPYLRAREWGEPYRPPEGWTLYRCLCGKLAMTRDPATSRTFIAAEPPEDCELCRMPFQSVEHSQAGYVIDLELPPAADARAYWRAQGLERWAFGDDTPE